MKIAAYRELIDIVEDGRVIGVPVLLRKFSVGAYGRWRKAADADDTESMIVAAFSCVIRQDMTPAFTAEQITDVIESDAVIELYTAVLEHNFGTGQP